MAEQGGNSGETWRKPSGEPMAAGKSDKEDGQGSPVRNALGVLSYHTGGRSCKLVFLMLLVLVMSLFALQTLYVWCEDPEAVKQDSNGLISPQVSIRALLCIASSHVLRMHTYFSLALPGGVEGDGGYGPNLASWTSQWERLNLSWPLRAPEPEKLPDKLMRSSLEIFTVKNVAMTAPWGSFQHTSSCARRPGPVMLNVAGFDVPCQVMWQCKQPGLTPKVQAACLDPALFDHVTASSLPAEGQASHMITPPPGKERVKNYEEFPAAVIFAANVYINDLGQMWDSKNVFARGQCWDIPAFNRPLYVSSEATKVVREEMVVNLCSSHASSQYHGLIELSQRLAVVLPVIQSIPGVTVLVAEADAAPVSTMFRILGFLDGLESFHVRFLSPGQILYADMSVSSLSPGCGKTSAAVWRRIRRDNFKVRMDSRRSMESGGPWYLVLAERKGERGLIQHQPLVQALEAALGKKRVKIFSDRQAWTMQATKELFSGASVFVASHGAGLSNMVFMPYSSSILEVRPINFSNPCYHNLADALSFNYYRFDTPGVKSSKLNINVEEVVQLVRAIVQAKGGPVPFYPLIRRRR